MISILPLLTAEWKPRASTSHCRKGLALKKKKSGREEIFVCLTQIIYFSYCNVSYFGDTDTVFAHAASHGHPNCTFGLKAFTSTAKHLLGDSVRALQLHLLYKPELRACANKHCCNVTRPCSKCILTNSCSSPSL